jgi:hypothetical protein
MRRGFALAIGVLALVATGIVVASSPKGSRDAVPPPEEATDCEPYQLRAHGILTWLNLEGGTLEFAVGGDWYDLYIPEGKMDPKWTTWLVEHPGVGVPADVEGTVHPCLPTVHMHGAPTDVVEIRIEGEPPESEG